MSMPETNVLIELEDESIKVVVSALVIAVVSPAVFVAVSAVVRGYSGVYAVLITAEVEVTSGFAVVSAICVVEVVSETSIVHFRPSYNELIEHSIITVVSV